MTAWTGAATARPLYDRPSETTGAAATSTEPRTVSASEGTDWTLPIMVAGAVVLIFRPAPSATRTGRIEPARDGVKSLGEARARTSRPRLRPRGLAKAIVEPMY